MKRLFLEGKVKRGKSTLIQECIAPYRSDVGGFVCVRLHDNSGNVAGYRLEDASCEHLDESYDLDMNDIFLEAKMDASGNAKTICSYSKHLDVFENSGVAYMKNAMYKKLMLLDEIGGIELESSIFKEALFHALDMDVPCLGVLKMPQYSFSSEENEKLRRTLIQKYDARIIQYSSERREKIRDEIFGFLEDIGLTKG